MENLSLNLASSNTWGGAFKALIRTVVTLKDGRLVSIITLLEDPRMFEDATMGVSQGLKSGDRAQCWQSTTYTLSDNGINVFAIGDTVFADDIYIMREKDFENKLAEYELVINVLRKNNNRLLNDTIKAHNKIGGLKYLLESNGIEIPPHLK